MNKKQLELFLYLLGRDACSLGELRRILLMIKHMDSRNELTYSDLVLLQWVNDEIDFLNLGE